MRTVTFVTQKGGAGKSTLAVSMAVAAREAGERVVMIDMDPQRSLCQWAKLRDDSDIPVEYVTAARLPRVLTELEKNRITLVVIDTQATDSATADTAIKACDLCVVPSRPTVFDLWSSDVTREKIRALGKEYVFVLNQCPPVQESSRVQDGLKALEAMGGLITPLIVSRADFQESVRYGLGPTEYAPSSKAADEIRQLWGSLKRRINKVKNTAARQATAEASSASSRRAAVVA